MLNEKKIRLMTRLALFEEKEKDKIKLDKYYRIDYIRYRVMKTLVSVTIGYLFLFLAVLCYKFQDIVDNTISLNYRTTAFYAIAVYILVVVFYGTITGIMSYFDYEKGRKNLKRYKKNLKALRLLYKEESSLK